MEAQVHITSTPCPDEVADYLLSRGWSTSNPGNSHELWIHQALSHHGFEWGEALAYENFRHLFLMKPVAVGDVNTSNNPTSTGPVYRTRKAP